ncbi:MAG: hypothetical protein R3B09_06030 [Nannocystaceae bacterium]
MRVRLGVDEHCNKHYSEHHDERHDEHHVDDILFRRGHLHRWRELVHDPYGHLRNRRADDNRSDLVGDHERGNVDVRP